MIALKTRAGSKSTAVAAMLGPPQILIDANGDLNTTELGHNPTDNGRGNTRDGMQNAVETSSGNAVFAAGYFAQKQRRCTVRSPVRLSQRRKGRAAETPKPIAINAAHHSYLPNAPSVFVPKDASWRPIEIEYRQPALRCNISQSQT